jgi:hypothetical protein
MRHVVEHQPRDRMHSQRIGRGRRRQLLHLVVVRMKGQRDERLETAGVVLDRPHAQHVINPLFQRLDVPVQHGDVRAHPETMRETMDVEIAIGPALVVTDFLPDPFREDLRAAARQRSAKNAISTAVKHFRWISGRIRLNPRSSSV